jgi:hypothetical protein
MLGAAIATVAAVVVAPLLIILWVLWEICGSASGQYGRIQREFFDSGWGPSVILICDATGLSDCYCRIKHKSHHRAVQYECGKLYYCEQCRHVVHYV